jgi:hypothetical protein
VGRLPLMDFSAAAARQRRLSSLWWVMEPDHSTTTNQGSAKNPRQDKTGKSVPLDEISPENSNSRERRDGDETAPGGGGNVELNPRHRKDRPEQGVNRGLHS